MLMISYDRFQKMKLPKYQGGKGKDANAVLTLCQEMLEVVGLVDCQGVIFIAQRQY